MTKYGTVQLFDTNFVCSDRVYFEGVRVLVGGSKFVDGTILSGRLTIGDVRRSLVTAVGGGDDERLSACTGSDGPVSSIRTSPC
jgi:hypothetical protein